MYDVWICVCICSVYVYSILYSYTLYFTYSVFCIMYTSIENPSRKTRTGFYISYRTWSWFIVKGAFLKVSWKWNDKKRKKNEMLYVLCVRRPCSIKWKVNNVGYRWNYNRNVCWSDAWPTYIRSYRWSLTKKIESNSRTSYLIIWHFKNTDVDDVVNWMSWIHWT